MIVLAPKASAATKGWVQSKGKWYYYYNESDYYKNTTKTIDSKYYRFDKNGAMIIGWYAYNNYYYDANDTVQKNTTWYYYESSGAAATGWKQLGNTWYYFTPSGGAMLADTSASIGGKTYCFAKDGAWIQKKGWVEVQSPYYSKVTNWYYLNSNYTVYKGWLQEGSKWYYLDDYNGMMVKPTKIITNEETGEGKIYAFNSDGVWVKPNGWFKSTVTYESSTKTSWYYFKNGNAQTGWQKIGNTWYYFDERVGVMIDSPTILKWNGKESLYVFNKNGALITPKNGWYEVKDDSSSYSSWWYFEKGEAVKGWKQIKGTWYYFSSYDGRMYKNGSYSINSKKYRFDKNGAMVTGWYKYVNNYIDSDGTKYQDVTWYYYDANGVQQQLSGWKYVGGAWHYFDTNYGYMSRDGVDYIDNKYYAFDKQGNMLSNRWYSTEGSRYVNGSWKTTTNWYYLTKDGSALSNSWKDAGSGKWYYFNGSGVMVSSSIAIVNNKTYAFDSNGYMIRGNTWYQDSNRWYYLTKSGAAATGWQKIGGTWYYFDRYSGSMFSNKFALIDGKHYAFAPSGAMLTGWYKYTWTSPDEQEVEHTYYAWYYLGTNGDAQIGWLTLSDGKYYLESDGQMVTGEQYIDGKLYKFDTEGRLVGEVTEETNDGDDDDNVVDGGNDVGSIPDFEAEETIVPEETIEEPTEDTETNTIDSEEVETEEVETIEEPVEETDSEGEDVQEDLEQIEEIEPVETAEN